MTNSSNLMTSRRHGSRRWVRNAAIAAALALSLVACGGNSAATTTTSPPSSGSDTAAVNIDNFAFNPGDLTVSVGTTVTWTNAQATEHTVTGDDENFDSANLPEGASFSQVFDTAGTFAYHCTIHPSMTATVTVSG